MRIWCQSCGAATHDSKRNGNGQAIEKRVKEVTGPDTIIEFHGVDERIPEQDRCLAAINMCQWQSIRNAFRAEQEGYDTFVISCTANPGFYEIKQAVDILVAFITETAIHAALMLASRFAFFVHNELFLLQLQEIPKQLGLAEKRTYYCRQGTLSICFSLSRV